jgi:hypothetical protein
MHRKLVILSFTSLALGEFIIPFEHSLPCMTKPTSAVQAGSSLTFEQVILKAFVASLLT